MRKRLLHTLLVAAVLGLALATALTLPAAAELRTVTVRLPDGSLTKVTLDVPKGMPLSALELPGVAIGSTPAAPAGAPAAPAAPAPTSDAAAEEAPSPSPAEESPEAEQPQDVDWDAVREFRRERAEGIRSKRGKKAQRKLEAERKRATRRRAADRRRAAADRNRTRNADGSPTSSNPSFFDAPVASSPVTGVPNFVIRKFRVPVFLLPIYQAAGIEYGVRWEILAAINEIETDYGRNLNVSSAGALGWMQFMPPTWKAYGVDANKDGKRDPYNPVDAIFAAGRYLKAAGYGKSVRRAIFAYNHADWYVDSVLLRARLISGVPSDLVGSLTGLTEGRFPVYARARYADDLSERDAKKRFKRGQNAARLVEGRDSRRGIEIFAKRGSPAVATNDGVIKQVGRSRRLGRFVVLQDVYGNRYTYAGLDSVNRFYPVPKEDAERQAHNLDVVKAEAEDPRPKRAASAGRQPKLGRFRGAFRSRPGTDSPRPSVAVKQRLFAHPRRAASRREGGLDQLVNSQSELGRFTTFRNYFSQPLDAKSMSDMRLKRLRKGARVIGGTILGRVGRPDAEKASHLYFEIRPAGRGAPRIDPKPILDGWKLLEATAIYRASGRNALHGEDGYSIGQIMMLPKPLLEKRVLADERIDIYPCGRRDIKSGQIDRRVLATIEYLAESGLRPAITSLKCGHGFYTASGNVSHHSSGNAIDIARINGVPILGHQERGGITEQAVRRLMLLQGTMQPDQIISLLDIGSNTYAMGDHADHIHVGFRPRFGQNRKLGRQAEAVLKPGQWDDLLKRLAQIENPTVPTKPSRFALPAKTKLRKAHRLKFPLQRFR